MLPDLLHYYSEPEIITSLDKHKAFTNWLTDDPVAIYQIVQGLIVHDSWLAIYGVDYIKSHEYPQKTAYMSDLLDKALELDSSSLAIPRHPRDRVIGCCREFATLMCALLRAKGIPSRSRCGFAYYFGWDNKYDDHWICEYWREGRWIIADPQADPFQQCASVYWTLNSGKAIDNNITHRIQERNPRDLKADEFITAGKAWKMCREGKANPENFGIECPIKPEWGIDSLSGLWFVRGQLLRDFAALNKVETVPFLVRICKGLDWKPWRILYAKDKELSDDDLLLLDTMAELTSDVNANFFEIRDMYKVSNTIRAPQEIVAR